MKFEVPLPDSGADKPIDFKKLCAERRRKRRALAPVDKNSEGEGAHVSPGKSEKEQLAPFGPGHAKDAGGRLGAVIERITQKFLGGNYGDQSDDDNDDPDNCYDSQDSFVDDSEMVEAIEKRKIGKKTKTVHEGFFVNEGELEVCAEQSPFVEGSGKKGGRKRSTSTALSAKKRKVVTRTKKEVVSTIKRGNPTKKRITVTSGSTPTVEGLKKSATKRVKTAGTGDQNKTKRSNAKDGAKGTGVPSDRKRAKSGKEANVVKATKTTENKSSSNLAQGNSKIAKKEVKTVGAMKV